MTRTTGRPPINGPRRYVLLTPEQDAYIDRLAAGWSCGWPEALRRVLDVLREAPQQSPPSSGQQEVPHAQR